MMQRRTDLAAEARELWWEGAKATSELAGVKAEAARENGFETEPYDSIQLNRRIYSPHHIQHLTR